MEVLNFEVSKKEIRCDKKQIIGGNDYLANFTLDEEWEDKEVICRVVWTNRTSLDITLEDSSCTIPAYMLKAGKITVGVYAESEENCATSSCDIGIIESIKEKIYDTSVPNKEIWKDIQDNIKNSMKVSEFTDKLNAYLSEKGITERLDSFYRTLPVNLLDLSLVLEGVSQANWSKKTKDDTYAKSGYYCLPPIAVEEGKQYIMIKDGIGVKLVANYTTYDIDGNYVGTLQLTKLGTGDYITNAIPSGIGYIRGSGTTAFEEVALYEYDASVKKYTYIPYGTVVTERNYVSREHKPTVVFNFDNSADDNRMDLLDEYGFNGCATFNAQTDSAVTKEIIKRGYDVYSFYGGLGEDGLVATMPDGNNATKEEWKEYLQRLVDKLKEIGVVKPILYASRQGQMYETQLEALGEMDFRYYRVSTYQKADGTNIYPSITNQDYTCSMLGSYGVYGTDADITELKTNLESAIAKNSVFIIFTHLVREEPSETDCGIDRFKAVLAHVKKLKDAGTIDVMSMKDYYNKYNPEQGAKDDFTRLSALYLAN